MEVIGAFWFESHSREKFRLARLIGKAFEVLLVRDHELGIVWADFADQSALGDCVLFVFVVDAIQHVVNVNAALGFLARDVPLDDWDFDGREGGHLNLLRECLLLSNFKEKLAKKQVIFKINQSVKRRVYGGGILENQINWKLRVRKQKLSVWGKKALF